MMKNNVINLTKQLIEIPSFKDSEIFESKIGDFLCDYIQSNFPWLTVTKQLVEKNRYNIFVTDGFPTKLLVIDQIDTVMPSKNWTVDPFMPQIIDGKLYGLGSSDSKGSIAAFLSVLKTFKKTEGLAMLWYVDEEYDFKGTKEFVSSSLAKTINPEYILSIDGDSLKIGRGCRGIIELRLVLEGATGHSARKTGININRKFMDLTLALERWLEKFDSDFLGLPTLNIARINSGLLKEKMGTEIVFGTEGNRIPDYLEATIEIRTTSDKLNFDSLKDFIQKQCKALNIKVLEIEKRFDLNGYETSLKKVETFVSILNKKKASDVYLDPGNFGFLDVSLLQQKYPQATVFSLGAGSPDQAHTADEYILLKDLKNAVTIYRKLLNKILLKGGE